jgi:uncharacterized NAD(P)/FAD-binding protein YdhS
MRTIAIIGAGFSGTATAVHLLRRVRTPVRIVLIDDQPETGAGLVYSPGQRDWLLNVPAARMSLDASRPSDLIDYVARQGMRVDTQDFLSRALYGRYLCARLHDAIESAGMEYARIWGRATRLALHDRARSWRIDVDDHHPIIADEVVLALGNPQPRHLAALRAIRGTSGYVHDPWRFWPQESPDRAPRRVLLLGTGLTMTDVALRLALRGPEPPEVLALSRHGRLPQPQTVFDRTLRLTDAVVSIRASGGSLRRLVRAVHALSRKVGRMGGDWREVVNAVRGLAPELWAGLDLADRRRFLRHVRPIWDVHRHRLPPAAADELQRMRAAGRLIVRAGVLERVNVTPGGIEVIWRPRGGSQRERTLVGRVFNCTGPDDHPARSDNPLVQSLLSSGLIAPDPLEIGIHVTADNEVIAADGRVISGLYYIGPWLRARDWEATAVPELREQARRLADRLARSSLPRHQESERGRRRLAIAERTAFH